ncbi:hypothetical protein G9A89_009123 [Geosiphon pyriformis]|nr:hypothetical protein G9A89_009123 [Geosiphon pyriformis]
MGNGNAMPFKLIKRELPLCEGFKFITPAGGEILNRGDQLQVSYAKGNSLVSEINSITVYYKQAGKGGEVKDLWIGSLPFESNATAEKTVTLDIPDSVDWVTYGTDDKASRFLLRTWARTSKGPDCVIYSPEFSIAK